LIIYADTSAVLKLVVEENESSSAADYLTKATSQGHQLVASMLLYTELHCAAHHRGIPSELVTRVLGSINLLDVARSDLMYAAALPGRLRSGTPSTWPRPFGCSPIFWWPTTPNCWRPPSTPASTCCPRVWARARNQPVTHHSSTNVRGPV